MTVEGEIGRFFLFDDGEYFRSLLFLLDLVVSNEDQEAGLVCAYTGCIGEGGEDSDPFFLW